MGWGWDGVRLKIFHSSRILDDGSKELLYFRLHSDWLLSLSLLVLDRYRSSMFVLSLLLWYSDHSRMGNILFSVFPNISVPPSPPIHLSLYRARRSVKGRSQESTQELFRQTTETHNEEDEDAHNLHWVWNSLHFSNRQQFSRQHFSSIDRYFATGRPSIMYNREDKALNNEIDTDLIRLETEGIGYFVRSMSMEGKWSSGDLRWVNRRIIWLISLISWLFVSIQLARFTFCCFLLCFLRGTRAFLRGLQRSKISQELPYSITLSTLAGLSASRGSSPISEGGAVSDRSRDSRRDDLNI